MGTPPAEEIGGAPKLIIVGDEFSKELISRTEKELLQKCVNANRDCVWMMEFISGFHPNYVSSTICARAEKEKVCNVTMGARGLSGWGQLMLGSVSYGVLHKCRCPVTIVKKGDTV